MVVEERLEVKYNTALDTENCRTHFKKTRRVISFLAVDAERVESISAYYSYRSIFPPMRVVTPNFGGGGADAGTSLVE